MAGSGGALAGPAAIEIEAGDCSVQNLVPPSDAQRLEGIAFSTSGNILAVATADTDTVLLYRRKPGGRFEDAPYSTISGPASKLDYPHDLAFSVSGDSELLAVALRGGSVSIFRRNAAADDFGIAPVFEIRGAEAKLKFSDGVAFVPPAHKFLATCNVATSKINFYRKAATASFGFGLQPVYRLKHASVQGPDGLAFSDCGKWLAVANHGNHTVGIYRRRRLIFSRRKVKYGPKPVTVIRDPGLRYPHSVAFTPKTNHLVVTNAGANYFSVYRPERHGLAMRWSQSPVLKKILGLDDSFKQVNMRNKMEGGPKGVAIHRNNLAVCGPEHGIKIYAFREGAK